MSKAKSKPKAKPKPKAKAVKASAKEMLDPIDVVDIPIVEVEPDEEIIAEAVAEPGVVESPEGAAKRGRAVKEPPPPKNWRVEGLSPEGVRVILGRFVTREEAEPELIRIKEDGFYEKVRLVEAGDAAK
ncbi:MAG TPA: hypothetical protein VNT79_12875 [Phycisphaerae bacterium]|nr:hypothetical protein [Phycisphaerae bacterium]